MSHRPTHTARPNEPGLYRIYRRLDALLFGRTLEAMRPIDLRPLLRSIPTVECGQPLGRDGWPDNRQPFDVALNLCPADPGLFTIASEVWSYGADSAECGCTEAAGFRHWASGAAVLPAALVSRTASGATSVLYRAYTAVHKWSHTGTLDVCYATAPATIASALAGQTRRRAPARSSNESAPSRPPTTGEMVSALAGVTWRYTKHRLARCLSSEQWRLAIATASAPAAFRELRPPDDRFWADPFPLEHEGRHYLFFEEFHRSDGKGRIVVAPCDSAGLCGPPVTVLERPYHLSYPFVFRIERNWYMIPETRANRTVELYVCTSFPTRWELCRTVLPYIRAADTTLAQVEDRWWMFTTVGGGGSSFEELYLFYSGHPLGKWLPHRANPVKSDVRSARPAGRLVATAGKLYRLCQDCSRRYGYAVAVQEITRLDPVHYAEWEAGRISPTPASQKLLGIHTFNTAGGLTVIDGLVKRNRFPFPGSGDPFQDVRLSGCAPAIVRTSGS